MSGCKPEALAAWRREHSIILERMGIEPTARCLQSTVAPLAHAPPLKLVGTTGFEPAMSFRYRIKSPGSSTTSTTYPKKDGGDGPI